MVFSESEESKEKTSLFGYLRKVVISAVLIAITPSALTALMVLLNDGKDINIANSTLLSATQLGAVFGEFYLAVQLVFVGIAGLMIGIKALKY